jgi:aromatic-L-amino-acid decarboxylase
MTPDEFRRIGHRVVDFIADYRRDVADLPVMPRATPGALRASLPKEAPASPEPMDAILADVATSIVPGLTHWQHPRFFGWFPSNGALASVLGDYLSTGLGVLGLSWQSSPALTELEEVVCDWMRKLLGLSDAWRGVIQDTASTSTLVALICARERTSAMALAGKGLQVEGAPLVIYVSSHAHSSVEKAALLAGFGRAHLRHVEVDALHAMRADALDAAIAKDLEAGLRPCAIVATSGTTGCTAFDPIAAIADVARARGVWLHVDAAMAGSAMILPEARALWDGIEGADSVVVNAHKWLGAAFDCSLYFVRDADHLVRVMSTNPSYLRSGVDEIVTNYRDWGIPLGRRFRALKLWLLLRAEGADALRARLRRDLDNAQWLAARVRETSPWRLVAPVPLQTLCVQHVPDGLDGDALDRHTRAWADRLNASGEALVTPSILDGRWMVRVSIGAIPTERADVEALWSSMQRHVRAT